MSTSSFALTFDHSKPAYSDDIIILQTYGVGAYSKTLKKLDVDLKEIQKRINEKMGALMTLGFRTATASDARTGVKETDTGLAPPNLWVSPHCLDRGRTHTASRTWQPTSSA